MHAVGSIWALHWAVIAASQMCRQVVMGQPRMLPDDLCELAVRSTGYDAAWSPACGIVGPGLLEPLSDRRPQNYRRVPAASDRAGSAGGRNDQASRAAQRETDVGRGPPVGFLPCSTRSRTAC